MDRRAGTRGRISATVLLATALTSLWLVVGALPAGAATIDVYCPPYGADNLQTAITGAAPGSTLAIHGTCTGNFTVNKNLTLQGVTAGASLNGNAAGTTLTVSTGATVKIQTLAITNGLTAAHGGGIRLIDAGTTVNLVAAVVSGNSAAHGGGITLDGTFETLTLTNSTVVGNHADGEGGGIENGVLTTPTNNTITLTGSTLRENTAGAGGGIDTGPYGALLTLTNSVLTGNTALDNGGGIASQSSTVSLNGVSVTGNRAFGGAGLWFADIDATITNSTITRNSTHSEGTGYPGGAGIYHLSVNDSTLDVSNSTIAYNNSTTGSGGGIANVALYGTGILNVASSQLSGNLARNYDGGGIFNANFVGDSSVSLASTRIGPAAGSLNGNQAGSGGGIANEAEYGVSSVSLANHTAVVSNTAFYTGGGIYNYLGTISIAPGSSVLLNHPNNCSGC